MNPPVVSNKAQTIGSMELGDPVSSPEVGPTKATWATPEDVASTWTATLGDGQSVTFTGEGIALDSEESQAGNLFAAPAPTASAVAIFPANDRQVLSASRSGNSLMLFGASTTAAIPVGSAIAFEGVNFRAGTGDLVVNRNSVVHMAKATQPVEAGITLTNGDSLTAMSTAEKFTLEGSSYTTTLPLQDAANYGKIIGNQVHQPFTGSSSNVYQATSSRTAEVAVVTGPNGATFTILSGAVGFSVKDASTTISLQDGKGATLVGVAISMQSNDVMIGTSTLDFLSKSGKEAVSVPTVAINGGIKENAETSAATSKSAMETGSANRTSDRAQDPTSAAGETVATSNGSHLRGLDVFTLTVATLTGVVLLRIFPVVRYL